MVTENEKGEREKVWCAPQDEDAGAEAEGDGERGAEDAALLPLLDRELLGLGRLEPLRRLEIRRRVGCGGGGDGGGVRLGPDGDEGGGPGARGCGAAREEERRRGRSGSRSHGLHWSPTATGAEAWWFSWRQAERLVELERAACY
jgi:hypothetical protein